ncbi:hypothetical protein [Caldalkalibacillus salinus]|uniref:hypothetical protein n=1 Tax=Caldalkalibacillus salinus TaxID=2803787 RepID=UPI0019218A21|nr:hypothetical protein [Caldalkalibacillus salinus]
MWSVILELSFKVLGYSMIIYGLWRCITPLVRPLLAERSLKVSRRRLRTHNEVESAKRLKQNSSYIIQHLEMVYNSLNKEDRPQAVTQFIFLTLVLFSVSTILLTMALQDIILGLFLGLLIGSLPYTTARIRLSGLRARNSITFLNIFHIILSHYQSTGKDIYFTLVNTLQQVQDPDMKQTLIKLVNAMQVQKSPREFDRAVQVFIYSIDSQFAKRFGKLVLKAHISRADIFQSLVHLDQDIRKRKVDIEEETTRNQDTVWQGYFSMFALPLAIFFSYQMSGVLNYWYFFTQKTTLSLFILCLVLSGLSTLMASAMRKPKADI